MGQNICSGFFYKSLQKNLNKLFGQPNVMPKSCIKVQDQGISVFYACQSVTTAAAKSLQSCPTLCKPRDGGPPLSTMQKAGPVSTGTCFNNSVLFLCITTLSHPMSSSSSICKCAWFFPRLKRLNPSSVHTVCQYLIFLPLSEIFANIVGVPWLKCLALNISKNLNNRDWKLSHLKIESRFLRADKMLFCCCSGKILN